MQIETFVTSKKSANGIPPPLRSYFVHYGFLVTFNVYNDIICKMAHVSFWQLGLQCVTAMLTPLPYNGLMVSISVVQVQS